MSIQVIPGFRLYSVTDDGRVIRTTPRPGRKPAEVKGTLLDGYRIVTLKDDNGKKVNRKVHQLVLETFVGPRPGGHVCCHRNGVRDDNRLENLRWGTGRLNAMDRDEHGTTSHGADHHTAKLNPEKVAEMRRKYLRKEADQYELASQYGVSQTAARRAITGQTWKRVETP